MLKLSHVLGFAVALSACGQGASFSNREDVSSSGDATGGLVDEFGRPIAGQDPGGEGDVSLPGQGADDETAGDEEGTGAGEGMPPMPEIPGAEDDDLAALHKCLAKWKDHPFGGTVDNFERISASVSVGGFGSVVNDTERTTEPYLILVDAGVNVGGAPVYNLLNPNGFYCIKVNVNVMTELTVNLHCNARLADQKVNVNVGSVQNDATSAVGVHVLSNVQVNAVRPEGDSCVR